MYALLSYLLQPFVVLQLIMGASLIWLWRSDGIRRKPLACVTATYLLWLLVSLPAVAYLANGSLEWWYSPLDERPTDAQAIVVFGGGTLPPDNVRRSAALDAPSMYRAQAAIEFYRSGGPCPVFLCGGKPDPCIKGDSCADLMREWLLAQGVNPSDVVVENRSRTTHENAVEVQKLLAPLGISRVVLITDAWHMVRSAACLRRQGIEVAPAGCRPRATQFPGWKGFLPHLEAACDSHLATHEWLGLAWYWACDRI
jgi:uncharacterized SAM-binding protein YcdF (DUF218 family)